MTTKPTTTTTTKSQDSFRIQSRFFSRPLHPFGIVFFCASEVELQLPSVVVVLVVVVLVLVVVVVVVKQSDHPDYIPSLARQQASEHLALHWGMKLNTEQTGRKMLVQKVRAPRERAVISWQSLVLQRRSFRSFAFSLLGVSLFASLEDLLGVMVGMVKFIGDA